ncbi:MAG: alpha/beta fold hydrolase [Micromonosporaceae bacterium]|nr:alpha/beta fold hydrolase [Micromonosporaceae bacterium]
MYRSRFARRAGRPDTPVAVAPTHWPSLPPSIEQRSAKYAGYRTRELVVAGDGQVLVLLHGFGHPADCWRPVLTRCADEGRAAVAVDLPGFGAADPLAPRPYLPQLADFVRDVVQHYGSTGPVVLVGNSLGGHVAIRLLDSTPETPVAGLVALGTPYGHMTRTVRTLLGCGMLGYLAKTPVWTPARARISYTALGQLLYGDLYRLEPDLVEQLASIFTDPESAARLHTLSEDLLSEVDQADDPTTIGCRAVIVHGTRDRLVSPGSAARLHAAIPHSRLELWPDIGHCPQLDAPERVLELAAELAMNVPERPETA